MDHTNMNITSERPQKLYKYKAIDGKGRTLDIIRDSAIYIPSPDKFNDPFECKPRFDFTATKDQKIKKVVKDLINTYNQKGDINKYFESAMEAVSRGEYSREKMLERIKESEQEVNETTGILSLSETHDNPIMWAHYTDSHRGICIEFNTYLSQATKFFKLSGKVEYQSSRIRSKWFEASYQDILKEALFVKSKHWEYEKEWRVINYNPNTTVKFPAKAISAIYLGVKCSKDNENTIIEILRAKPFTICRVPDDRISQRSYPLLASRELIKQFIQERLHGHQAA